MKRWKRAIGHVAVFALLGVVMSYAVAWGAIWKADASEWDQTEDQQLGSDSVSEALSWQGDELRERGMVPGEGPLFGFYCPGFAPGFRHDEFIICQWADVNTSPIARMIRLAAGFPCYSCQGWLLADLSGSGLTTPVRGTIGHGSFGSSAAFLPLQPLWPGLLINTAFYGGLLWLLWFGPGMIRRGVRRCRGLCVRCGYDLRGAVCPECGGTSR